MKKKTSKLGIALRLAGVAFCAYLCIFHWGLFGLLYCAIPMAMLLDY